MANFSSYQEAARHMFLEVEKHLYAYRQMKQELEAFELRQVQPGRPEPIVSRCTTPADPTGNHAVSLAQPPAYMEAYRKWISVIEQAYEEMLYFSPELARVMHAFYGMDKRNGRKKQDAAHIRISLMHELNISQTTLYNWRNTCVEWVKALAIYAQLLTPTLSLDKRAAP